MPPKTITVIIEQEVSRQKERQLTIGQVLVFKGMTHRWMQYGWIHPHHQSEHRWAQPRHSMNEAFQSQMVIDSDLDVIGIGQGFCIIKPGWNYQFGIRSQKVQLLDYRMRLSFVVVLLLATAVLASEIDPMKGVTCCTECNQVRRDQGLSYSYGMESYIFKNQAMTMLKYNMGINRLMSLLSFYPSNFTTFLAKRVLDIDQRVTYNQAVMAVEIDDIDGDVAYEDLDDAYVLSALQALKTTISKNLLSQDLEYINTKKKAIEEIQTRYKDWINSSYYKQQMPQNEKKAKVAVMALVQSDLMVMGAVEQEAYADQMEDIRDQCYSSRTRNMLKCLELPETARWKVRINKSLIRFRFETLLNQDRAVVDNLLYQIRTSASGQVSIKDVGYVFPHRIYNLAETSSQEVYERGFRTILTVYRKNGINSEDAQLYDLISSLRFDGKLEKNPTSSLDENSLEYKAKQNSVWSYITATYLAPIFYQRYGKSLLNALHSSCPMTCNQKC